MRSSTNKPISLRFGLNFLLLPLLRLHLDLLAWTFLLLIGLSLFVSSILCFLGPTLWSRTYLKGCGGFLHGCGGILLFITNSSLLVSAVRRILAARSFLVWTAPSDFAAPDLLKAICQRADRDVWRGDCVSLFIAATWTWLLGIQKIAHAFAHCLREVLRQRIIINLWIALFNYAD